MSLRRVRIFGVTVLSIETTTEESSDPGAGDVTTASHAAGFVRDDLAVWHRPQDSE